MLDDQPNAAGDRLRIEAAGGEVYRRRSLIDARIEDGHAGWRFARHVVLIDVLARDSDELV